MNSQITSWENPKLFLIFVELYFVVTDKNEIGSRNFRLPFYDVIFQSLSKSIFIFSTFYINKTDLIDSTDDLTFYFKREKTSDIFIVDVAKKKKKQNTKQKR